jgi:hypothetical protein
VRNMHRGTLLAAAAITALDTRTRAVSIAHSLTGAHQVVVSGAGQAMKAHQTNVPASAVVR